MIYTVPRRSQTWGAWRNMLDRLLACFTFDENEVITHVKKKVEWKIDACILIDSVIIKNMRNHEMIHCGLNF